MQGNVSYLKGILAGVKGHRVTFAGVALHEHFEEICKRREVWGAELARRADVSEGMITRIKKRTTEPGLGVVRKLAQALEVTIDYLAGEKGNGKPTDAVLASESLELFCRKVKLNGELRREL